MEDKLSGPVEFEVLRLSILDFTSSLVIRVVRNYKKCDFAFLAMTLIKMGILNLGFKILDGELGIFQGFEPSSLVNINLSRNVMPARMFL